MTPERRDITPTFGELLRSYRAAARLSQEMLAERAGLSAHGISDLERGARRRPYPATVQRLAEALGLTATDSTLLRAASRPAAPAPSTCAVESPTSLLPGMPSSFVGREREVAALTNLLMRAPRGVRLVTLTGPPGTGKTRLALQVAAELANALPDGPWFVPLETIRDPGLVSQAIARVLGVRDASSEPLIERLISCLNRKSGLLVLDNFEQVLPAAPLVANLLAACPRLRVMVTSRAPLRLYGEQEFVVPPLVLPDGRSEPSSDRLKQVEAVRLFVDRAQAVRFEFDLNQANGSAVAEICRQLDGLPLAIELAAARTRVFSPPALLERLADRLSLLTNGPQDQSPRQRTLRGALDWSYELLSPTEQTLFRRLGVFAGGCTLETASAVCDFNGDLGMDVLDGLTALVDQSLVRVETESEGGPRFGMLESIRAYARERLVGGAEWAELQQRHAQVFLVLAEAAEARLRGPDQTTWLDRLEQELPNLRLAVEWSLARGDPELGLRAAAALWVFLFVRGHAAEGREWLAALLTQPGASVSGATRARALFTAGMLAFYQRDHARGRVLHQEGLTLQRQLGDQAGIASALFGLGQVAYDAGDLPRARSLHEEALTIRRALGDSWTIAFSLVNVGTVVGKLGDAALGRRLIEEGLTIRRRLGDRRGTTGALCALAELAIDDVDHPHARALYREIRAIAREIDDRWMLGHVLAGLASLAAAEHRWSLALRLGSAAAVTNEGSGSALFPGWRERLEHQLQRARQALGPIGATAEWAEGSAGDVDALLVEALAVPQDVRAAASPAGHRLPVARDGPGVRRVSVRNRASRDLRRSERSTQDHSSA